MPLIPFSAEHLRVHDALPFDLHDAAGRLLLARGVVIDSALQLAQLCACALFVDERESQQWRRRLMGTVDEMVRRNERLKDIAQALPAPGVLPSGRDDGPLPTWLDLRESTGRVLGDAVHDAAWRERVEDLARRVRSAAARRPDAALYLLIQTAQHEAEQYSRHHALLCAVVCDLVAQALGRSEGECEALVRAALTMNVSITALQDQLALQQLPLTAAQREAVRAHAAASERLLRAAGVDDPLWLEPVRLHHAPAATGVPLSALAPGPVLARLLRRVDIFTAKLSRRSARAGLTPTRAARDACLGDDGRPDEVGQALLRALGLYPPGSYVRLRSGEVGVVLRRGRRADLPIVAALVNAAGQALGEPVVRDAVVPEHGVVAALGCDAVRVRLNHERMLRLRGGHRRGLWSIGPAKLTA